LRRWLEFSGGTLGLCTRHFNRKARSILDEILAVWMNRVIEDARRQHLQGAARIPEPTDKLKLLFAGYNGTRNTGSDVRVEEMLRQVRHLFGADRVEATVFSFIQSYSAGYFDDARLVTPAALFPRFLGREVPKYHGVIACEGSTFKSKFTDLLTIMFVGALGVATACDRLSIAYGAEAGHMNPWPKRLTTENCRKSLVVTRNEESRGILAELGVPSELGTDTAWTFAPLEPAYAEQQLRGVGWKGEPVLVVCPINPFWWPVKASLLKGIGRLFGFHRQSHYGRIFFFTSNRDVEEKFDRYLAALAGAVDAFRRRTGVFVVTAASEEIDNDAMRRLSQKLGGVPTFSSSNYNMYQLVSIFRAANMMLSSRYHAIVTSMAGHVASAGVTMDERIANLMKERGHEHLLMTVDDPDLEAKAGAALETLRINAAEVVDASRRTVAKNLRIMSGMGQRLVEYVRHRYPSFEPTQTLRTWEDYLPPLGRNLHALLEDHSHTFGTQRPVSAIGQNVPTSA
jgi:polysaccharide pyruvyl transferase WcaK-like protein